MTHEEEKLSLIIERVESDLRSLKKVMQVKNKIGSDFDIDIESIVEPSEKNDSCMVPTNVLFCELNEYVVNHGNGSYEIFTEDAFSSLFEVI